MMNPDCSTDLMQNVPGELQSLSQTPVEAAPACLVPVLDGTDPKSHANLTALPGYYGFNTTDFQFRELFESILQCDQLSQCEKKAAPFTHTQRKSPHDEGTTEHQQHVQREAMRYFLLKKQRAGKSGIREHILSSPRYSEFVELYLRFVRREILPLFEEAAVEFAVQVEPTIRVHQPGGTVLNERSGECAGDKVGMHRDTDLGHQENEVTFVIALTDMFGTNSVWAESASGLGDFAPFTMQYGYFHRWHSAQSRHYNMINRTGNTRISIDFRVMPMNCCEENPTLKHYFVPMNRL